MIQCATLVKMILEMLEIKLEIVMKKIESRYTYRRRQTKRRPTTVDRAPTTATLYRENENLEPERTVTFRRRSASSQAAAWQSPPQSAPIAPISGNSIRLVRAPILLSRPDRTLKASGCGLCSSARCASI